MAKKSIAITIEAKLDEQIEKLAVADGRSKSNWIERAIIEKIGSKNHKPASRAKK